MDQSPALQNEIPVGPGALHGLGVAAVLGKARQPDAALAVVLLAREAHRRARLIEELQSKAGRRFKPRLVDLCVPGLQPWVRRRDRLREAGVGIAEEVSA